MFGPKELFVIVPFFLLTVVLPIVAAIWVLRELVKQSRKLDLILDRLGEREGRAPRQP